MTQNQIAYWNLKENQRHNKVSEDETNRSNVVKETETNRANLEKERLNRAQHKLEKNKVTSQEIRNWANFAEDLWSENVIGPMRNKINTVMSLFK